MIGVWRLVTIILNIWPEGRPLGLPGLVGMRRTGTPVAGRRSAGNETMTAVSLICFARTPPGCDMLPHPPYPTKPCSPKRAAIPQSIVSSLRDVWFVVCRIVLPGFRPCRDVGEVRFTMYDVRNERR